MLRSTSHLAIACACLNTKQNTQKKIETHNWRHRTKNTTAGSCRISHEHPEILQTRRLDEIWHRIQMDKDWRWASWHGRDGWALMASSSIHSKMEWIRNHNNQFKAHSKVTTVHTGISIINALHLSPSMESGGSQRMKRLVWTTWRRKKRSCQSMARHKNSQKRKKETDAVLMSLWHGNAHDEDDKVVLCVRRVAFSFTSLLSLVPALFLFPL